MTFCCENKTLESLSPIITIASNSDIITFVEWQFHFTGFVISLVHCLALKYENSENLGPFLLIMIAVTFTQSKFIVLN